MSVNLPTPARIRVTPAGQDAAVWAAALAAAPRVDLGRLSAALTPTRSADGRDPVELVVVAAHPDDETLGLGRLAYAWARSVGPVTGVLATAGEACVDHVMERPAGIAARRVAEWHAALDQLGFTDRHHLDLADGQLGDQQPALTAGLTRIVTDLQSAGRPVVLAAPWRGDPHPDHRAAGRATARVAAATGLPLVEFGVWMTYWAEPAAVEDRGQVLLVVPHGEDADRAHARACRAFSSQLEPITAYTTPVVPPEMLAHHREQLLIVSPDLAATLNPTGEPA